MTAAVVAPIATDMTRTPGGWSSSTSQSGPHWARDLAIVPLVCHEPIDPSDWPAPIDHRDWKEPIDNIDIVEPSEPHEANDAADPMDRIEPVDPIDKIDSLEQIDSSELRDRTDQRDVIRSLSRDRGAIQNLAQPLLT